MELKESELPGIGKKFAFDTQDNVTVTAILHKGGQREIYVSGEDDDDNSLVLSLNDNEARVLGAVLGGAYYAPVTQEALSLNVSDLHLEWIKIPDGCSGDGKSIGDLEVRRKTGASVIAILRGKETLVSPGPGDRLHGGDKLVATGLRSQVEALKRLLGAS